MTQTAQAVAAEMPQEDGYEQLIPVDHLHPNPDNPRLEAGDVTELAASIRKLGLLQALLVRPAPELGPGEFWIEAGYRRWVAMRAIGYTAVRCHVRAPEFVPADALKRNLMVGLIENIHRENLDPIEKALSFGRLRDECHLSLAEIARESGFHPSTVSTSLALLELAPKAQEDVRSGKLGTGQALKIVRRHRRTERKKKFGGSGRVGAVWEPDWFTRNHPLSGKAEAMCDARGHNNRRRRGGACDHCWDEAIRADQRIIDQIEFRQTVQGVLSPPPSVPWTPENPALRQRANGHLPEPRRGQGRAHQARLAGRHRPPLAALLVRGWRPGRQHRYRAVQQVCPAAQPPPSLTGPISFM